MAGTSLRGVLKRYRAVRRRPVALWLAFYFTVPLAIYDWIYCGLYLGHGLGFTLAYWYLTVYYVIPWILLPVLATLLNRGGAEKLRPGTGEEPV